MPKIELSPEHVYTVERVIYPGVTDILHVAGAVDDWGWTEYSRWRGTQIHKATHYHDQHDLDERTVPAEIRAYLAQWKLVLDDQGFEILEGERHVFSKRYGYCGTFDRLIRFHRGPWKGRRGLLDIKRFVAPAARLQTAAYAAAVRQDGYLWPRVAVGLQPDSYKIITYPPESYTDDLQDFIACKRVAAWRIKHIIGGKRE